jgi:hypothetical protein
MKKTFFLATLLFVFQFVNAQDASTTKATPNATSQQAAGKKGNNKVSPEQKAEKFTAKMTEAIGLEETQKTKVKSLALDHFKTMEAARIKANGDKEKIKAEAKKSRKIFNEGLKKVLSPTQFEAWKAKRKEAASKRKNIPTTDPVDSIED